MQFSRPVQEQFDVDGITCVIFEPENWYIRGSAYVIKNDVLFNEDIQVSARSEQASMDGMRTFLTKAAGRVRQSMEHYQPDA